MAATSWRESKDAGRRAFLEREYSQALFNYSEAIDQLLVSSPSPASAEEEPRHHHGDSHGGQRHLFKNEHQILLSNVIACRLKIGGKDMAEKAVEEAKLVSTHNGSDQLSFLRVDILCTHFNLI